MDSIKLIEEELREAQEALEIANNANQALLETLSHDLRTPLNTIIGFADMINQGIFGPIDNPQYRSYIDDIYKSGRTMLEIMNDVLDFRRFEKLEKSEKDFRHIIELAPDLICVCRAGLIRLINPAGANMLGVWPVDTVIGRPFKDYVHQDYAELLDEGIEKLVSEQMRVPLKLRRKDGLDVEVEIAALPYEDEEADSENPAVMLMARDVSERNRAIRQVAAREAHLRKIMDTVADGIVTMDANGTIETVNPAVNQIFAYQSGELVGHKASILLAEEDVDAFTSSLSRLEKHGGTRTIGSRHRVTGIRHDGTKLPVEIAISMLLIAEQKIFIAVLRDITEQEENERRLRELATQDPLTKMPNRNHFGERLEAAIAKADRTGGSFAVVFVDLDNFKYINDAWGHVTGDRVIQMAGIRLKKCVSDNDLVAHFGGDEFSIIVENGAHGSDPHAVADAVLATLAKPFRVDGKEIYTSGSIGVVEYPEGAESISEIMKNADTAAHHAKKEGRNNVQFYSSKLSSNVQRRMEIENGLRHALANDEFTLLYQAKVDLDSRRVKGAEALLRWESPYLGFVSPVEFVPVAEETGLIVPIGAWVIKTACKEAARWRWTTEQDVQVGVNLSALQFLQGDLTNWVEKGLSEASLDPKLLDLELTESMLVENPDETIRTLLELKKFGITVSMDDFGTGYSSLSYLTRFPLDSLKVDRAFVTNLPEDEDAVAIASAIVNMAKSLNLQVVAEGIETEGQVGFLHRLGAEIGQGYFFSKPVSGDKLLSLIRYGFSEFATV